MTAHSIPRVDWRDNTRGLPLAAFDGSSIKQQPREQYKAFMERINRATDKEIEDAARSAVERISDRPQTPRPGAEQ